MHCGCTALELSCWRVAELGLNERLLLSSLSSVPLRLTVKHQRI